MKGLAPGPSLDPDYAPSSDGDSSDAADDDTDRIPKSVIKDSNKNCHGSSSYYIDSVDYHRQHEWNHSWRFPGDPIFYSSTHLHS